MDNVKGHTPTGCIRLNIKHVKKNSDVLKWTEGTEYMTNSTLVGDLISYLYLQTSTKYSNVEKNVGVAVKQRTARGRGIKSLCCFTKNGYPWSGNLEFGLISDEV